MKKGRKKHKGPEYKKLRSEIRREGEKQKGPRAVVTRIECKRKIK